MDLGINNGLFTNTPNGVHNGIYTGTNNGVFNGVYNENLLPNNINKNDLLLYLDTGFTKSYPRSGNNIYDLSGKNNTCLLNNGITYNQINNGSLVFDGVDDFVSSTINLNRMTNVSFSIWYKWNGVNQFKLLSYLGDASISGFGFLLSNGAGGSGNLLNILFGNLSANALPTSASLSTLWANYVVTRDTLTTTLYQNSNLISSTNTSPVIAATYNFKPCGQSSTSPNAAGNVAQVLFYNRVLSQSEINQNYLATKSRFNL